MRQVVKWFLKCYKETFFFYKINDPLVGLVVRWRKEREYKKGHRWLDNSWGSCEKQRKKKEKEHKGG